MKNVYEKLCELGYDDIKDAVLKHISWAKGAARTSGNPKWFDEPGTLNVIGIDCDSNNDISDEEIEFNLNTYKDFLVLVYNKPGDYYDMVILEVTVDPNRPKEGRANLMPGSYDAYSAGIHGLSSGRTTTPVPGVGNVKRWALRQERKNVYVARTHVNGKVYKYEWGMFYINVHDPNVFADSGIACTVIKKIIEWYKKFVPYLYDLKNKCFACSNHDNLTYNLINHKQLEGYLAEPLQKVEKAEAVGGADGLETIIESKKAKKAARL